MPLQVTVTATQLPDIARPDDPDVWLTIHIEGFELPAMVCARNSTFYTAEHKGLLFPPEQPPPAAPVKRMTKKRQRKLAQKQEQRVAAGVGGQATSSSGTSGDKGDGRVYGRYRIENKYTRAKSYRVTRADLQKIRSECVYPEQPAFQVDFRHPTTQRVEESWVLIPEQEWRRLVKSETEHEARRST